MNISQAKLRSEKFDDDDDDDDANDNNNNNNNNNRTTLGIKILCKHKRELYSAYRNSNNLDLKRHYQLYCKNLFKVIKKT